MNSSELIIAFSVEGNEDEAKSIVIRPKRDAELEQRATDCKALEYAGHAAGLVADVAGDLGSIPIVGEIIGFFTAPVAIWGHVIKSGTDIAATALNCANIPFDEIKEILDKKFNEVDKKLDKNTAALEKVSSLVSQTLRTVERTRIEMKEGFLSVLNAIKSTEINNIITNINNYVEYFVDEREKLRGSPKDGYVDKLMGEDSILEYLRDARTPKADSLNTFLFEIVDKNFAIPENMDDETAFQALEVLCYGTQTYISIMFFLLEQHAYLAEYHYQMGDIDEFNNQFDIIKKVFEDFKFSLISVTTGKRKGILIEVFGILDYVLQQEFISQAPDNLFYTLLNSKESLDQFRKTIDDIDLPLIKDTPNTVTQILFDEPIIKTPIGEWKVGNTFKYAVQYTHNGIYSKVSKWSDTFTVAGLANPVIKLPIDRRRDRLIFRMINDGKPQLIGVIRKSYTQIRDINRDLYNAAGGIRINKEESDEFHTLFVNGADINATFEEGRCVIHAIAMRGNRNIFAQLSPSEISININKKDVKGYTPLHIASDSDQSDFVKLLMDSNADVNAKTNSELTSLHLAAQNGYDKTVESLLQSQSIDVNVREKSGLTPLHIAALYSARVVKALLSHKDIDVNAKSEVGLTPLHMAIFGDGDPDIVEALVSSNEIDLNAGDVNNMTPLHFAAMAGYLKMVKFLLSLKSIRINIAAADNKWTPLHFAIFFKREDVAMEILKNLNKIDLEAYGDISPLHLAIATGQTKIILELLSKGANIEERTREGYTPLHMAAMSNDQDIALMLIDRHADINAKTIFGSTPLHLAAGAGGVEIVLYLINKGADIGAIDEDENTALHEAVLNNNVEVVKIFIERDQSLIYMRNKIGDSLIDVAAENLYTDVVIYLVQKGADVNTKNMNGMTPLLIFTEEGDLSMVEFLISQGADINITDNESNNYFMLAVRYGHLDIVKYAYENNEITTAGYNKHKGRYGEDRSPTFYAVCEAIEYDRIEIVKYLVSSQNGKEMCYPLLTAAQYGHLNIVEYLVEQVAMDVNEKATDTQSTIFPNPLCTAAWFIKMDVVRYLVQNGANIDASCKDNQNALYWAIHHNQLHVVEYLCQVGIDPREKDKNGNTPLHHAANFNYIDIVKYLIEIRGVDVNARNNVGDTPLHMAANNNAADIYRYLISKGAEALKNDFEETPYDLIRPNVMDYFYPDPEERLLDIFVHSLKTEQKEHNASNHIVTRNKNYYKFPFSAAIDSESKFRVLEDTSISRAKTVNENIYFPISSLASDEHNNYFKRAGSSAIENMETNGTLLLLDVIIRKFTKKKYNSVGNEPVSEMEAQASALDITEKFEELINELSNRPAGEQVDLAEVHSNIYKAIKSGNESQILKILCAYVKTFSAIQPQDLERLVAAYMSTSPEILPSKGQSYEEVPHLLVNTCFTNDRVGNDASLRIEKI